MSDDNTGKKLLLGQGPGSEAMLTGFVLCHGGKFPATFQEVEEHFARCERCKKNKQDYLDTLEYFGQ